MARREEQRGDRFGNRHDYQRELADDRFRGPYARDDYNEGYGGDWARDSRWGGTGAPGDIQGGGESGRGHASVGYGPAQTRGTYGGSESSWRGLGGEAEAYGGVSHRGRGPRNYRRSDERIAEEVNDRLTDDIVVDATDVEVTVENGEVTLSGTVHSRYAKRRAEDVAEACSGVRDVHNRLTISDRETTIGKASE